MRIKKNIKLLAFAMIGIMSVYSFSSCSEDDSVSSNSISQKGDPVDFSAIIDNANGTRATPTTSSNYLTQMKDFKVWGLFSGSTEFYLGAIDKGIYITHTSGKSDWSYKTATDMVYWPTKSLDFYAISPSDDANYRWQTGNLSYTIPTDQSKQVDLLYATANNQLKTTNAGIVNLNFHHALSQVVFKGITKSSNLSVEVKGITIHNLDNAYWKRFSGLAITGFVPTYSNYAVGLSKPTTVNSTSTSVSLTDNTGALMLKPQALTPWTDKTTISSADGKHQCYLEIECKITSKTSTGVSYLVGSATAYGKTYIPLGGIWDEGKRYIYTLQFGVGKDENGNDYTSPISFTVSVQNWNDSSSNISL